MYLKVSYFFQLIQLMIKTLSELVYMGVNLVDFLLFDQIHKNLLPQKIKMSFIRKIKFLRNFLILVIGKIEFPFPKKFLIFSDLIHAGAISNLSFETIRGFGQLKHQVLN